VLVCTVVYSFHRFAVFHFHISDSRHTVNFQLRYTFTTKSIVFLICSIVLSISECSRLSSEQQGEVCRAALDQSCVCPNPLLVYPFKRSYDSNNDHIGCIISQSGIVGCGGDVAGHERDELLQVALLRPWIFVKAQTLLV
jgi:hypothetical protein